MGLPKLLPKIGDAPKSGPKAEGAYAFQHFHTGESVVLTLLKSEKKCLGKVHWASKKKLVMFVECPMVIDTAVQLQLSDNDVLLFLGIVAYCGRIADQWSVGIEVEQIITTS